MRRWGKSHAIPELIVCPVCNAPHDYLFYNDGKKKSQLRCKVCSELFQADQRFRKNERSKYFCPYCNHALFRWKAKEKATIYKCCNDDCQHRIQALNKLKFQINGAKLSLTRPTNFNQEKEIQALIEKNLETVFNCRFIASEFSTGSEHAGRIDTLVLSEDSNPVIIEYKKVESSELINQSLYYLSWIKDSP